MSSAAEFAHVTHAVSVFSLGFYLVVSSAESARKAAGTLERTLTQTPMHGPEYQPNDEA